MAVSLAALFVFGAAPLDGRVEVVAATAEQRSLAHWAVARFEDVGLVLPPIEIRFHGSREGCRGRLGRYSDGVAHLCWRYLDLMAARTVLHELAHGWVDANLGADDQRRFLELRGLTSWNDPDALWDERGFEHAAEIIAWGIGDQSGGTLAPSVPRNEPAELAAAFEMLTGRPLPELRPWMLWGAGGGDVAMTGRSPRGRS
ncbi:MAG: hypothetical protein ACXWXK_02730 [Actinomycetota bacterium]